MIRDVPMALIHKAAVTEPCGCVPVVTPKFDATARTATFTVPLDVRLSRSGYTNILLALDEKDAMVTECRLYVDVKGTSAPPPPHYKAGATPNDAECSILPLTGGMASRV